MNNLSRKNTSLIKNEAIRLGFDHCGIAPAGFLEEEAPRLEWWLKSGMNGSMKYMENHFDMRLDPRKIVDNARSVLCLLLNYFPEEYQQNSTDAKVSKYAYGQDYHTVIKKKLKSLLSFIKENVGEVNGRIFVDSAPVLEKAWAQRAGLGWIGKNSNLLRKQNGSFFFIAELILDIELEYDHPVNDHCGTCTLCIDACPTGAIIKPYVVDGSRCISYFTIELKDHLGIPEQYSGKTDNWIFGCDVCQDVCPWNRFSKPHRIQEFEPVNGLPGMSLHDWEEITEEIFLKKFSETPLKRTGYKGIKRNLSFIRKLS